MEAISLNRVCRTAIVFIIIIWKEAKDERSKDRNKWIPSSLSSDVMNLNCQFVVIW